MTSPESVAPIANQTAEELILGLILSRPQTIAEVAPRLLPMAFTDKHYREIYHTALMLHCQNAEVNLANVWAWLKDAGAVNEESRFLAALLKCQSQTLTGHEPSMHLLGPAIQLVSTKYLRRLAIGLGKELIDLGSDFSVPIEEIVAHLAKRARLLQDLLPDCVEQGGGNQSIQG